ncbi:polymorphic toxin-type HINT domain-containing protein [Streptomyces sp. NPDC005474]|uniref:polymorphic toxin-type HINT domain-containing protein n=1 Tax=Streptomyces sp. NPDC005474 TaxID=3154878 RepID=UPI00345171BC
MAGVLVVGLLPVGVAAADSPAKKQVAVLAVPHNKRVPVTRPWPERGSSPKRFKHFDPSGHTELPAQGSSVVTLLNAAAANRSAKTTQVRAGSLPVLLGAAAGSRPRSAAAMGPQRVRVTMLAQQSARAAGVHGVLFTLQRTSPGSGKVALRVDDSSFRYAFGGDFASRLHLVQLPACALTTPKLAKCQEQTAVRTAPGTPLSAQVTVPGPSSVASGAVGSARSMTASSGAAVVMAAASGTSGSSGDYAATSLSPGGSWSTSGNTGAFTYSYPISVPPAIGGAAPNVDLSYSSASQDARTEGTNNQSSWLGDGWTSTENFVERTYKSCRDDSSSGAPANDGDQCWAGQILTLSLNGKSTDIVYDDSTKTFRSADDSATTKIEDLTGATNGTANGEYFKVTEGGVQYFFGRNRLPGWSSGKSETKSVWTVPVYHAHSGVSDCPDSTDFASTSCTLGYRFNLDYAVDLHGNATAWYYAPDTGYYGADMKDTAVSYTRGGTLSRIDYGMTASSIYSGTAPEQILFDASAERCVAGTPSGNTCADSQFTAANAAYWPDVPIDLDCAKGSSCTNHGPSFWSRKRLTSITTQIQTGGATKQADKYTFTQSFPDGGDHAPTLWLDSIQHTGLDTLGGASGSTSTPAVSFDPPLQLPNRVGTIPQMPLMYHDRIQTVTSESGAQTTVTYDRPNCSTAPASDPNDPTDAAARTFASTNTLSCFPVYWTPDGQPAPWMDWFYKYKVASVVTVDPHNSYQDGTQPELETDYTYKGNPGWHHDDNELVKAKNRTWGQFRGYPEVDVTTGDPNVFHKTNGANVHDQKTLSKTYYFLGMNGDTLPGGKTRSVPALTSQDGATSVADDNILAGQVFETDTYTSATGSLDKAVVTVPKIIGPTASRNRSGAPDLTAQMVRTAKSLTRQAVSYGWRKTEADTFYNTTLGTSTTGMPVQADDRGETADSDNVAKCTYTRYLTGSADTVVLPAETVTTAQDCSSAGATLSGTLISDTRTSYDTNGFAYDGDGQTNPALPKVGDATLVQVASAASGATATAFVDQAATRYDSYGRAAKVTRTPNSTSPDGKSLAQTAFTSYTPATGALPTASTTTTQVTPGVDCSTATASSKDCQLVGDTLDPARALPTAKTDAAGRLTSLTYDALGRMTGVWLPNESKANGAPANTTYTYRMSQSAPSVVATNTLLDRGSYQTNETLYDAMLRPLQVQATAENSSTAVSDTQYDSHGWTVVTNNAYSVSGSPRSSLIPVSQVTIPDTTVTDHDGQGRTDLVTEEHDGAKTWTTTTAYTGDRTTVLPPKGGVASAKVVNARGQTTELDQYTAVPALSGTAANGFTVTGGTTSATTYGYSPAGQQHQVTGPDHTVWTYDYDLLGRKKSQNDPDAGKSGYGYDDAGNLVSTTDTKQVELDYTYDLLGRKLTGRDKSKSNFQFASWAYDTLRIGLPTSSTRYVQGVTGGYTVAATGYTALGKPTGTKITLPASETPLPSTYTTTYTYTINDQLPATQSDPRTQGLNSENITYGHDELGNPTTTGSSANIYVGATVYTDFGALSQVTQGASTNPATTTYGYDDQTLRLTDRVISRTQAPGPTVDDTKYAYDASGNPTSTVDQQSETGNTVIDRQCYNYDALDRLTDAWTANDNCSANPPTAGTLTTTAGSYWQSFSYDAIGNRRQSVDHAIGSSGTTVTTTYANGCTANCNPTGTQPHTLTATTGGTNPTAFVYDENGNLHTRTPTTGPGQTLTWDDEGHLAQVDTGGPSPKTTKYLYDADGSQLIRRDPGQTTLFVGDTQIVVNTGVTPNVLLGAVRTYTHGGGDGTPVAVRSSLTGGGLKYLFNDPHGTATLSMDTTTQQVARQQYTPYGQPRTSANTTAWPDPTHAYLGKPQDTSTGYTDVGARKYDPTLGRFISVDPVLEVTDPQELGGYTYAADNPVTSADPSGLESCYPHFCSGSNGTYGTYKSHNDPASSDYDGTSYDAPGDEGTLPPMKLMKSFLNRANPVPTIKMMVNYGTYRSDLSPARNVELYYRERCTGEDLLWTSSCEGFQQFYHHWADIKDVPSNPCEAVSLCQSLGDLAVGMFAEGGLAEEAAEEGVAFCSFDPQTPVLMAGRKTKPIGKIKPGDRVESADPSTGKHRGPRVVTAHLVHHDDDLVDVTIHGADGHEATLHTTSRHPFWDDTLHTWIPAGKLKPGHVLNTATDQHVRIDAVIARPGAADMYNLTVQQLHTYYVLAGTTPVLVHNSCPRFIADSSGNVVELPKVNSAISRQKQDRHILGGNGYRNGGYFNSQADAQAVLDAYQSGTAEIMGITKTGNIQVRVPSVVGYDNNPGMNRFGVPTNIFMIKGTKSPSVVPMNPQASAP